MFFVVKSQAEGVLPIAPTVFCASSPSASAFRCFSRAPVFVLFKNKLRKKRVTGGFKTHFLFISCWVKASLLSSLQSYKQPAERTWLSVCCYKFLQVQGLQELDIAPPGLGVRDDYQIIHSSNNYSEQVENRKGEEEMC